MTEDSCCPCTSLPTAPPQVQTHLAVPLRKPWTAFYWHRQICPERQASAHKYDDRCTHTFLVLNAVKSHLVSQPPLHWTNINMHAYTHVHAEIHLRLSWRLSARIKTVTKAKEQSKGVYNSRTNQAPPPESLGRTSTLQASLVVSEMVEP